MVDVTLIPIDRVVADRPFYSGEHTRHEMNLQVIASPQRDILWVSGALPGSVHDKKAEWIWGVLYHLEAAGLITVADKGYRGSTWAKIPYRGKNKPEPQKEVNRAHAKLRAPGERANAQLKNWRKKFTRNRDEKEAGGVGVTHVVDPHYNSLTITEVRS